MKRRAMSTSANDNDDDKSGDDSSNQVASNLDQSPSLPHDVRSFVGEGQEGNVKNGKGIVVHADGSRYEGEFLNGKYHGSGILTLSDGYLPIMEQWKDGVQHGIGTCSFANGNRYQGEFEKGEFHGTGIHWLAQGGLYVGSFQHGIPNGEGTAKYSNNKDLTYIGQWKDGKEHGFGTMVKETQDLNPFLRFIIGDFAAISGQFQNGLPQGRHLVREENGSESIVAFKNGEQTHFPSLWEYKKLGMRTKLMFSGFGAISGAAAGWLVVGPCLISILFY
jgi:hypothetical protein